ncbi:hypothetical protein ES703_57003 [subsurface metagenome]
MMYLQSTSSSVICQDKKCCLFWSCFTWPGGPVPGRTTWPKKGGAAYGRMILFRDSAVGLCLTARL